VNSPQHIAAAICNLVVFAFCIVVLIPTVYWIQGSQPLGSLHQSLWKQCVSAPLGAGGCQDIDFSTPGMPSRSLNDAAIAGVILTLFFSFASLLAVFNMHKPAAIVMSSFALVFSMMAVGTYAAFFHDMDNNIAKLPFSGGMDIELSVGFGLICAAAVASLVSLVLEALVRRDPYESLI